jgi:hypothetical protein
MTAAVEKTTGPSLDSSILSRIIRQPRDMQVSYPSYKDARRDTPLCAVTGQPAARFLASIALDLHFSIHVSWGVIATRGRLRQRKDGRRILSISSNCISRAMADANANQTDAPVTSVLGNFGHEQ